MKQMTIDEWIRMVQEQKNSFEPAKKEETTKTDTLDQSLPSSPAPKAEDASAETARKQKEEAKAKKKAEADKKKEAAAKRKAEAARKKAEAAKKKEMIAKEKEKREKIRKPLTEALTNPDSFMVTFFNILGGEKIFREYGCSWGRFSEYIFGNPYKPGSIQGIGAERNYGRDETRKSIYYTLSGSYWYGRTFTFSIADNFKDGMYTMDISIKLNRDQHVENICVGTWKKYNNYNPRVYFLTNPEKLLEEINPYASEFSKDKRIPAEYLLIAPQLELLYKAGYSYICDEFLRASSQKTIDFFNRLCKKGKNLKEIFQCPKWMYKELKDSASLETWDFMRKLYKKTNLSKEDFLIIYRANYSEDEIDYIYRILNKTYNDKPIFNIRKLQNYLDRVDFYEAISPDEALPILADYLQNCDMLEMRPKIDGDSLKREHDISSRLVRQKRDEILNKKMIPAWEKSSRFDYEEDVFMVRAIKDFDDLRDEATQQHNCVAGYANRIVDGTSRIFTMRYKASPNKSLVTIELNSDFNQIRQKFLAFNQPIRSKAMSEFIERWMAHNRKIRKEVAA